MINNNPIIGLATISLTAYNSGNIPLDNSSNVYSSIINYNNDTYISPLINTYVPAGGFANFIAQLPIFSGQTGINLNWTVASGNSVSGNFNSINSGIVIGETKLQPKSGNSCGFYVRSSGYCGKIDQLDWIASGGCDYIDQYINLEIPFSSSSSLTGGLSKVYERVHITGYCTGLFEYYYRLTGNYPNLFYSLCPSLNSPIRITGKCYSNCSKYTFSGLSGISGIIRGFEGRVNQKFKLNLAQNATQLNQQILITGYNNQIGEYITLTGDIGYDNFQAYINLTGNYSVGETLEVYQEQGMLDISGHFIYQDVTILTGCHAPEPPPLPGLPFTPYSSAPLNSISANFQPLTGQSPALKRRRLGFAGAVVVPDGLPGSMSATELRNNYANIYISDDSYTGPVDIYYDLEIVGGMYVQGGGMYEGMQAPIPSRKIKARPGMLMYPPDINYFSGDDYLYQSKYVRVIANYMPPPNSNVDIAGWNDLTWWYHDLGSPDAMSKIVDKGYLLLYKARATGIDGPYIIHKPEAAVTALGSSVYNPNLENSAFFNGVLSGHESGAYSFKIVNAGKTDWLMSNDENRYSLEFNCPIATPPTFTQYLTLNSPVKPGQSISVTLDNISIPSDTFTYTMRLVDNYLNQNILQSNSADQTITEYDYYTEMFSALQAFKVYNVQRKAVITNYAGPGVAEMKFVITNNGNQDIIRGTDSYSDTFRLRAWFNKSILHQNIAPNIDIEINPKIKPGESAEIYINGGVNVANNLLKGGPLGDFYGGSMITVYWGIYHQDMSDPINPYQWKLVGGIFGDIIGNTMVDPQQGRVVSATLYEYSTPITPNPDFYYAW